MTTNEAKDLQVKKKEEMTSPAEQTMPGFVFTPAVDIFEDGEAITVLGDMPGVSTEGLTVDLDNQVLTLRGDVQPPENDAESDVIREYRTGRYYRQFTISDTIDQNKIEATLADGVLQVTLPKAEAAKPRRIAIKAG